MDTSDSEIRFIELRWYATWEAPTSVELELTEAMSRSFVRSLKPTFDIPGEIGQWSRVEAHHPTSAFPYPQTVVWHWPARLREWDRAVLHVPEWEGVAELSDTLTLPTWAAYDCLPSGHDKSVAIVRDILTRRRSGSFE